MPKATSDELDLHRRLLAGDETASADAVARLFGPLVLHLKFRFPDIARYDAALVQSAALEALLGYIRRPDRFQPETRTLLGFLKMAAEGDLKNAWKTAHRHFETSSLESLVELGALPRNKEMEAREDPAHTVDAILAEDLHAKALALLANDVDRRLGVLILDGVRETSDYAAVLGIADLPEKDQETLVKRAKDRIKATWRRSGLENPFAPD